MKLLTKQLESQLRAAGYENMTPICKFFTPWGAATWLITYMDEDNILYGYANLGYGTEFGSIATLQEMQSIKGPFGLTIERDLYWSHKDGVDYFEKDSLAGI